MHFLLRALVCCSLLMGTGTAIAASNDVKDLSLDVLPVTNPTPEQAQKPMVIFLTGDGGWAELDKSVSAKLRKQGMPVVGWSTLTYFWHVKTPEQTTADFTRILHYYLANWHRQKVILAGYSFGAEIIPFIINRLDPADRAHIVGTALLVPSTTSSFEIHVSDWLKVSRKGEYNVEQEIRRITDIPTLCMFSKEDDDDDVGVMLCPLLAHQPNVHVVDRPGGHNFDKHYRMISEEIQNTLKSVILPAEPAKSASETDNAVKTNPAAVSAPASSAQSGAAANSNQTPTAIPVQSQDQNHSQQ